jgi:uncharacterized lipoprotein YehR (DUF1307 family)
MSRISLKLDILHKQVTQSLVTYPEQKVEEKEDALRAFQPAADDHCCHEKVAASLRLQTSTSPALKKLKYFTQLWSSSAAEEGRQ